ncbi:MAG: quinone-interacting membrane-bound oxidoreductase complex subunit QmoC [Chloroflexi bacterium]|nr:quinone-interacting membrane-bound oxidoreductase complex subunit QmoC [Chloroflexota bacterium]
MPIEVVDDGEFVAPDASFVKDIINLGGNSARKCFQCGTCSVICPLSPDDRPFPRKEMIWVQWGLKDRLLKDPDVWLCHQCSDCSDYCPRGSRPGDVMAAIRSYSITQYAIPGFFARAFSRPQGLPAILGLSILLLFGFLNAIGSLASPAGEVAFYRFIPSISMEIAGSLVSTFAVIVAAIGLLRFWRNLDEYEATGSTAGATVAGGAMEGSSARDGVWSSASRTLLDILKHSNFGRCGVDRLRYYSHLAILYGFILLLIATTGRAAYHFLAGKEEAPALTDPVKLAGNLGALLLIVGVSLVIYGRLSRKSDAGRATYFDWFFILVLYLTAITGVLTQVARLAHTGYLAYWVYLAHLLCVFLLLAYAPYSKFAHLFYRALAMLRARRIGREASTREEGQLAPMPEQ